MVDHPIRDSIRRMDGRGDQSEALEDCAWMRENAPLYFDDPDAFRVERDAELPKRCNNFIVGIEAMPVTFTPSKAGATR